MIDAFLHPGCDASRSVYERYQLCGTTLYKAQLHYLPSLRPAYAYVRTLPYMEPDLHLLHLPQISPITLLGGSGATRRIVVFK